MIIKSGLWVILVLICCKVSTGQPPPSLTSSEIYLGIRKLNVLGSVLYVAAHPDDENTRLITYFSKDRMYRTGYLSMTRGDGGQNLIGEEQGIELGLIRTQELLAARRIDGGEQYFSRAYDFGYSKNADETFRKWNKEAILSDVVWVIRNFRPDVIITRFPTTGEGGHGHHTASAILAVEAFEAAGDPTKFPEQLKHVSAWSPKRILWNSFNFGNNPPPANDQRFRIDVGDYNPLLGKSYGEIAAESRSQHKSQGFGVPRSRGEALEYFAILGGSSPEKELFDGVGTGWSRLNAGHISRSIDSIAEAFDLLNPERSVPALVSLYKNMSALAPDPWRDHKLAELRFIIEQSSGLWLDAFTSEHYAVHTDSLRINFQANSRLLPSVLLRSVSIDAFDTTVSQELRKNRNFGLSKTVYVDSTVPLTQPYWLRNRMEEGYFNVTDQKLIGQPDVSPSFLATFTVSISGHDFLFSRPVRYKFTDPVRGELYQPLIVIPSVLLKPDNDVRIVVSNKPVSGNLMVNARKRQMNIRLGAQGTSTTFFPERISTSERNQTLQSIYSHPGVRDTELQFLATDLDNGYKSGLQLNEIRYDHVPHIAYFTNAELEIRKINVETAGKRLGYITGAGDKVPEALEQMGYEVVILGEKELARNDLNLYDAIITGVRAYNTNAWLNNYHQKLMKYVEEGGNLIVQYNTSTNIGPVRARIGPYPFNIVRTRITDETSPVEFLLPDHPVFNVPNKISSKDFEGWVQERSIYHIDDTASNFVRPLGMNDPGEKKESGALAIAKYGKGYFTYTGLVFFRQLPAGTAGAYRLLANLIALNKKSPF